MIGNWKKIRNLRLPRIFENFPMTEFFPYDNLTWPEVADLPRDVPLVLPLGSSFDTEKLAAQLGHPNRVGILPSIPFGWRGG